MGLAVRSALIGTALIRTALIRAGAAALTMLRSRPLQTLLALAQVGHHAGGIVLQPFAGTDAVEPEGGKHRQALLGERPGQSLLQIRAKARSQAIQPLLKCEVGMKAAAVQRLDQSAQAAVVATGAQLRPAALASQPLTPTAHLLGGDARRGLGFSTSRAGGSGMSIQPLQLGEAPAQLLHFLAQGLIFGEQALEIAGHRPGLPRRGGPTAWIEPHGRWRASAQRLRGRA